jgi:Flp pilus assembly protein TadD
MLQHLSPSTPPIWLAAAVISMGLIGCSSWPPPASSSNGNPSSCEQSLNPTDNTKLAGIEQLVNEGKNYAALAQLDALGATSPQSELVRADAFRRIDRDADALAIYTRLSGGCLDGRVQHGLGLIAAKAGQRTESVAHLQRARQAIPTDPRIRNDLGYALLLAGDLEAAQFEFLTVLDLNQGDVKAGRNLVLVAFLRGQADKARVLTRQLGLDDTAAAQIERQAATLQARRADETRPALSPSTDQKAMP